MTRMLLRSLSLHRYLRSRYQKQCRFLFVAAAVAIYILALLPQAQAPQLHWSDKVSHLLAFMVLALLLRKGFGISYLKSVLLLIFYGGLIEVSQYFTPDRSAEWADIGADTVGILIGLTLYRYLRRLL